MCRLREVLGGLNFITGMDHIILKRSIPTLCLSFEKLYVEGYRQVAPQIRFGYVSFHPLHAGLFTYRSYRCLRLVCAVLTLMLMMHTFFK